MKDCNFYEVCEQSDKTIKFCMHCKNFQTRFLKFITIDDWNRPIFEVLEKKYYVSDLNNLFDWNTSELEIKSFYKDKDLSKVLTYHGSSKDCEPMGNQLKEFNFVIV